MTRRSFAKSFAKGVFALVMAVLLLFAVINTQFFQQWAIRTVEYGLGVGMQIDSLRFSIWHGRLRIKSAQFETKRRRELIAIENLDVRFDPLWLLAGQFYIKRLTLDTLYITSLQGPPGTPSVDKLKVSFMKGLSEKIVTSFPLRHITLADGRIGHVKIMVQKRDQNFVNLQWNNLWAELSPTLLGKNNVHLGLEQFLVKDKILATALEVTAVAAVDGLDLQKVAWQRPEGYYNFSLNIEAKDKSLEGALNVSGSLFNILQEPFSLQTQLSLKPPWLYLRPATLRTALLEIITEGRIQLREDRYLVKVSTPSRPLEQLWKAFRVPSLEKIGGDSEISGELRGVLPELKGEFLVQSNKVTYGPLALSPVALKVSLDAPTFTWQLASPNFSEGAVARAEGILDVVGTPRRPVFRSTKAQLIGMPAERFWPLGPWRGVFNAQGELFQKNPDDLSGQADLTLSDGGFAVVDIEKLQLKAKITPRKIQIEQWFLDVVEGPKAGGPANFVFEIFPDKVPFSGTLGPQLALKGFYQPDIGRWNFQSASYQDASDVLNVTGFYGPEEQLNFDIKGGVGGEILNSWRRYFHEASGRLNANLKLLGNLTQPRCEGRLDFNGASLRLVGLSETFDVLNGRAECHDTTLSLNAFRGEYGGGEFQLGGTLGFLGFNPHSVNLQLKGSSLTYRVPKTLQLEFDADLKLVGTSPSPLLSGKIDIIAGRYYKNFILTEQFAGLRKPEIEEDNEAPPFWELWDLDLQLRNNGDLKIDNNVAEVYLDGDMRARGTPKAPWFEGAVTTQEGEIHYLGRNLEITQGRIEFRQRGPINPYILIEAQESLDTSEGHGLRSFYTVLLKLEGLLNNLQTSLSSIPPLDQADVVSLLAFGMTQNELKERGSTGRAFATNIVANSLTSGFGQNLGDRLGLDVLRFESGSGSREAISGVAVGKKLSDRLSLEFYTDISPESAQRQVRSKYYLTDQIYLEGINVVEPDKNRFQLNLSLQFTVN